MRLRFRFCFIIIISMCFLLSVFGEDTREEVEALNREEGSLNRALLADVLQGAAGYCRKLEKSAFHYFCRETVRSEGFRLVRVHTRYQLQRLYSRQYDLDYQLIKTVDGIREQRKNISGEKTGKKQDFSSLITSFLSERPVFAPVMIIGKEGQKKFRFTLEKIWTDGGRRLIRLRAVPLKRGDFFFTSARLDVDALDYSVNRIRVVPRYIHGYEKLMAEAFNLRSKLYLECEIRFDQVFRGLRFPSYISIVERYRGGAVVTGVAGTAGFDKSKTEFVYDNYRFFNVDMSVKED